MDYDYLDLIKTRYNYLRKYTPSLLDTLIFKSNKSLDIMHELNAFSIT